MLICGRLGAQKLGELRRETALRAWRGDARLVAPYEHGQSAPKTHRKSHSEKYATQNAERIQVPPAKWPEAN